jgi:hypothetical protein
MSCPCAINKSSFPHTPNSARIRTMISEWLLPQLHWHRPGFWLLASFGASLVLLILGRYLGGDQRRNGRLLRWILIPYLGLLAGGLSPRLMGLSDLDWVAGLGLGVVLISAVWVLLVLIRITLHLEESARETAQPPLPSVVDRLVVAGAQEFHWTFLRAAVWEILLLAPMAIQLPGYWAVWVASLLALPGIATQYRDLSQRLIATVVLITTAILFFYTRNFWLCWLLHATAQMLLGQKSLSRRPVREV